LAIYGFFYGFSLRAQGSEAGGQVRLVLEVRGDVHPRRETGVGVAQLARDVFEAVAGLVEQGGHPTSKTVGSRPGEVRLIQQLAEVRLLFRVKRR